MAVCVLWAGSSGLCPWRWLEAGTEAWDLGSCGTGLTPLTGRVTFGQGLGLPHLCVETMWPPSGSPEIGCIGSVSGGFPLPPQVLAAREGL